MTIRTLIVDDSPFFRRSLIGMLKTDPEIEVVGEAGDGAIALDMARRLKPDIITMDVEMPVMDGITAVRRLHAESPSRILMFSHLTVAGARATLDALAAGAADFMPKSIDSHGGGRQLASREICSRIRALASSAPQSTRAAKGSAEPTPSDAVRSRSAGSGTVPRLVSIGASTGGPVAVQKVLLALRQDTPCPVLVTQHMPANFTRAFAERLDQMCAIRVKEAEHDEALRPGVVYVAPGGQQMRVRRSPVGPRLVIEAGDPGNTYKPCVDITFESVAEVYGSQALAIVLTGMGADGREGAQRLKRQGGRIWAESQESCVVYGMPQAVVNAGLTDQVLAIDALAQSLARLLNSPALS